MRRKTRAPDRRERSPEHYEDAGATMSDVTSDRHGDLTPISRHDIEPEPVAESMLQHGEGPEHPAAPDVSTARQTHDAAPGARPQQIESLAQLLSRHVQDAKIERAERDRERERHAAQLAELQRLLADEQAQAARVAADLRAEVKQALDTAKPRAARKFVQLRARANRESTLRAELERQVSALKETQRVLEQQLAEQEEANHARCVALEQELAQARAEGAWAEGEIGSLNQRLEASEAGRSEGERRRDGAANRVVELETTLVEAETGIETTERALEAVSADRDRIEAARKALEARMTTRDQAEREFFAERDAERRIARAHHAQLIRTQRRMTEITGGLATVVDRLASSVDTDDVSEVAPPQPTNGASEPPPESVGVRAPHEPHARSSTDSVEAATIVDRFLSSTRRHAGRPALRAAGATHDYADLRNRAASIAATLGRHDPAGDPQLTAVFSGSSVVEFGGLLGILMAGRGYVPLDHTLSIAQSRSRLQGAGCKTIVADASSARRLPQLLGNPTGDALLVLPDLEDCGELRQALPGCRVLAAGEMEPADSWSPIAIDPAEIAYLRFAPVADENECSDTMSHGDVLRHVDTLLQRNGLGRRDRGAEPRGLTFDDAFYDLLVAWERGACVDVPD